MWIFNQARLSNIPHYLFLTSSVHYSPPSAQGSFSAAPACDLGLSLRVLPSLKLLIQSIRRFSNHTRHLPSLLQARPSTATGTPATGSWQEGTPATSLELLTGMVTRQIFTSLRSHCISPDTLLWVLLIEVELPSLRARTPFLSLSASCLSRPQWGDK